MKPPRASLAALLACALIGGLGACGDPIEDYCHTLKDHRKELNQLVEADTQFGLITHRAMLEDLAAQAPDDLADEWQVFLRAVRGLDRAVEASGHRPAEFKAGAFPDGVSESDQAAVKAAADRLASPETLAAASGIDQQARDVCKVNLGR